MTDPFGPLSDVALTGPEQVLPARYDVTGLAAAAVAWAASGAAQLLAVRNDEPVRAVSVDRVAACATFAGERLLEPIGWSLPPIWDPLAGDYRAANGWVRLHTNYPHHRSAVLAALGLPADCPSRERLAAAVSRLPAGEVESAVVAGRGPAAALHSPAEWAVSPAAVDEGTSVRPAPAAPPPELPPADLPLAGVRVLDLTRVIAGPVATRYLAAYGADVLRIDPPGFPEVPALLPEVTAGKRCAALDLRTGRDTFLGLVEQAHVLVAGLRREALARLGLSTPQLRAVNPALVTARLTAYGWDGPWAGRRGFDSLVQMSTGIAYLGEDEGDDATPAPLPVQALDHATGYVLAGCVCRALAGQLRTGQPADIRTSLLATAAALTRRSRPDRIQPEKAWSDALFETTDTAWGPVRRVRIPGRIEGVIPRWSVPAGPLGRHRASFA